MDTSPVSAILGAQAGTTQVGLATDVLRMNADSAAAIVQVLDTANQTARALANVGAGIGTKLDIST
ncbi:MAG TPA: hypothetical protein VLX44_22175 [Xanthobacteraceae bacterium]|nr:hypothetical protein [Xanthobacteraceae bacterium]